MDNRQFRRLQKQQEAAGGPVGIFGEAARQHDLSIREVMNEVNTNLKSKLSSLDFRHRMRISKREINNKLSLVDSSLGQVLFVQNASIQPDGGTIEVKDRNGDYRIILVTESKHQGNDVERIQAGIKQGKNKDSDLMVAGNAIERVHKNIQEFRNLMLNEFHFPYVVFMQGSNFATSTFHVEAPDGRQVEIPHNTGSLNRIDRVTASSFGMEINKNHCRNMFVDIDGNMQMLQAASLYFQSDPWTPHDMMVIMWEIAMTSLEVLSDYDMLPSTQEDEDDAQ